MKKYLIFLILFISIFIGFNSVKAQDLPTSFNKNYSFSSYSVNIDYNFSDITITQGNNINTYTLTKTNFVIFWNNFYIHLIEFDSDSIWSLPYPSSSTTFNRFFTTNDNSVVFNFSGFSYYLSNSTMTTYTSGFSPSIYQETYNCSSCGKISQLSSWGQIYSTVDILNSSDNVIMSANIYIQREVINKVIDLGDNSFGFYQDYVGLNLTSLSGTVDTLSVVCEEDRPFNNNYCFINYNDLINHNSDVSVFNDYGASFTQMFGKNTGYLLNDRYYLYSFRIQKPFVPQVGNLFINSLTNNSNQVNILGVYLQDGGSYTDYVVKFKISNSDYTSSTSLNDIMVVFRDGLSNYFSTIPTSFNYSVYRSFKLQYFSTEPTMEQVNDFYNYRDLSTIDGISSNNSFFTDNDFNTYGFGGIITAPFRFLYAIENYETCSDIVLPFPHSNDTITLKCVRNTIPTSINPLITILQLILSGFICYRIAVETLSIIKDISNPENANIEVIDL